MTDKQGKILATFRVEPDKWELFKTRTGNASALLVQWMDAYLDNYLDSLPPEPTRDSEFTQVAEKLLARFDELETRIEKAVGKVGSLPNLLAIRDRVIKEWKGPQRIPDTQLGKVIDAFIHALEAAGAVERERNELEDEATAPSKREFEQLQLKAYRFETAHRILLEENERLQKQVGVLQKELDKSQSQVTSQQRELKRRQQMLSEGGASPLPDLYAIRDQVIRDNRASNKLNEHAWKMLNVFIEGIEKGTGDYTYIQRLQAEIEQMQGYVKRSDMVKDEIQSNYEAVKKRLRLLGDKSV